MILYSPTRTSPSMKTIVFQTGGTFHPVEAQANLIQSWLPSDWKIKPAFGAEAFEQLADADLYVAGGLHWTLLSDLSTMHEPDLFIKRSTREPKPASSLGLPVKDRATINASIALAILALACRRTDCCFGLSVLINAKSVVDQTLPG